MKSILFVDDEPWFHESLRYALEGKGFTCLVAEDVSSAMKILKDVEIAVVVTDVMMPAGPDYPNISSQEAGFAFVKLVREHWPRISIVCLSVIGDQQKIKTLLRRGVRYLRKGEVPLARAIQTIEQAAGKFSY